MTPRLKLRTLLILLALLPPVAAGVRWLWIEPETISLTAFLALVGVLLAVPWLIAKGLLNRDGASRRHVKVLGKRAQAGLSRLPQPRNILASQPGCLLEGGQCGIGLCGRKRPYQTA